MITEETTDTVLIGAGPAGLAVAACLGRAGVPFVQLERAETVASTWRAHYRRLHLHTVKEHSALPHRPFPGSFPRYVPRERFVSYLDDYAAEFGVAPRFGQEVRSARRSGDGWVVRTDDLTLRSTRLVVATGYSGEPRVPTWPGQDDFEGDLLHSSRYADGAPWSGQPVLVVGMGNSGAEIAIDLWEHGASPSLAVRSPVHVMPRDFHGVPSQLSGLILGRLPLAVADRVGGFLLKRATGDLERFGIRSPDIGPASQVQLLGRVPVIDVGTADLIRQGKVAVVPHGVESFTRTGVRFTDGSVHDYAAVVLATGYKAALRRFLDDSTPVTDDRGYPTRHGVESQVPGLYFLGFRNPITGQLRDIAIEARRVAALIAAAPRA